MKIKILNRCLSETTDFDILISDMAELIKRVIQAKREFINGGMTISAPIDNTGELECVIPEFN